MLFKAALDRKFQGIGEYTLADESGSVEKRDTGYSCLRYVVLLSFAPLLVNCLPVSTKERTTL